jgi:hypothetical protein
LAASFFNSIFQVLRGGTKKTMKNLSEQTIFGKRFQTGTSHIQRRASHSTMSLDGSLKIDAPLPTHVFGNRLQNNTLALCHPVLVISCSLQMRNFLMCKNRY